MIFSSANRNFGLDIARSLAILLVLLAHSGIFSFYGMNPGFLGVEIFFVLSGFLIGQIILKDFRNGIQLQNCGTFYINRWLRTFPLYYLVLIIKDFFIEGTFHPKHYLFLQQNKDLQFFPVSWSLAIEEWFYLLMPLVLLVNIKIFRISRFAFIVMLILLINGLRFFIIAKYNLEFDEQVRKSIPLRFDSLLVGVLFSIIKINHNDLYKKISRLWSLLLFLILFVIATVMYQSFVLDESSVVPGLLKDFCLSELFLLYSFSFGFMIIRLEQSTINRVKKSNGLVRIITIISVLTYSIYLIHLDIFKYFIESPAFSFNWAKEVLKAGAVLFPLAIGLHLIVEKPLMDYRKSFVRKIFSKNGNIDKNELAVNSNQVI